MSRKKLIKVFTEGDDDRVVLQRLLSANHLPDGLEIVQRPRKKSGVFEGGYDQLVRDIVALTGPEVSGDGIVVRDLDELDHGRVVAWFSERLRAEIADASVTVVQDDLARAALVEIKGKRTGLAAIVDVGLPDERWLREMAITQFAMDDYLLLLVKDPDVYAAVSEFAEVPADKTITKLQKTTDLLRGNQIEIRHTKRLLHLVRGITGFRASPAACADRLIDATCKVYGADGLKERFQPLIDSVSAAAGMIDARRASL